MIVPIFLPSGPSGPPPTLRQASASIVTAVLLLAVCFFVADWIWDNRLECDAGVSLTWRKVEEDPRLKPLWDWAVADGRLTYGESELIDDEAAKLRIRDIRDGKREP